MAQKISQGNIFGRIGSGIGKGLAEQVPKEIDRYRLQSGLKSFQENMAGKSPLKLGTELLGIPGMTPEYLYTLSPLIQQQQAREAGGIKDGQAQAANLGNAKPQNLGIEQATLANRAARVLPKNNQDPYIEQESKAAQKKGLKTLEQTTAQLTPIVRKNDTELYNEAAEISKNNPVAFPTPKDALPIVTQNENARIANLTEQRNVGNAADLASIRIRDSLQKRWEKEKSAGRIPETIQSKILAKIEDQLASDGNKLSESQLIDKYSKVGDDIARNDTLLEERSKMGWLSGNYTPSKIENTISLARNSYKNAGGLEEFQDLIASKFNLDAPGSAYLAFPPQNTEANKIVNRIKKIDVSQFNVPDPIQQNKSAVKVADDLSSVLDVSEDSEDSILSYLMYLKQKNIDPQSVINRLKQNIESGVFAPNARQQRELNKGFPTFPSLGNIYLYSLMNKEKLVED